MSDYQRLLEDFPFLTLLTYGGNEYVGIVQNIDDVITTIYDYAVLKTDDDKRKFLELADAWWWESNRQIPINIFLKKDWIYFRFTLKTFNSKDVDVKFGPALNLKETVAKRSKRRSITLVRRVD
jgi:hypothetical protein